MDFYLSRNGETYGPYSEAELRGHLASGSVLPHDHAWREGESEWQALELLLKKTCPIPAREKGPQAPLPEMVEPLRERPVAVVSARTAEPSTAPKDDSKSAPEGVARTGVVPDAEKSVKKTEKSEAPVAEQKSMEVQENADVSVPSAQQIAPHIASPVRHQEKPKREIKLKPNIEFKAEESLSPAPNPPPRGRRVLLLLPLLLIPLYLLSPLVSLVQLDRALGNGDGAQIERLVDFDSLKEVLGHEVETRATGPSPIDPVVAQRISERFLNPGGLPSLLACPDLALREQSSGTFASMTPQHLDLSLIRGGAVTGPDSFVLHLGVLKLSFRLSGWCWRLEGIIFPS